ncbi:nucleoside deaminase [Enterococcus faecalis]|uniref:nucleoside deaminase n=1 Tax=Enterococcus faecalis TaxID=1351 RepID=UPI0034CE4454
MSSKDTDKYFMEYAISLAKQASEAGNEPFGAILVKDDIIMWETENKVKTNTDPTAHAELKLVSDFCSKNKITDLSSYTLYTSCEPCCMCSGAIVWSKIGRVVYSLSHSQLASIAGFNIMISSEDVFSSSPFSPEVTGEIMIEKSISLYTGYFKRK